VSKELGRGEVVRREGRVLRRWWGHGGVFISVRR
jgi:hypothetical protein